MQDNRFWPHALLGLLFFKIRFYNSGIGSVDWVLKRWYPNALHIKPLGLERAEEWLSRSPWLHERHPSIQREAFRGP